MNQQALNNLFSVAELRAKEEKVLKFFNKLQREAMAISAHDEYIVAARGTGKSEGLDVRRILQCAWAMPGSTGGFISPSYAKAWGNTIPAICHALSEWGYIEGIHYVAGRKAPKALGFAMPKRIPFGNAWENAIHFWNGTVMLIISFSQAMSANSMSLDWIVGSEAKFLDYNKIKSEVNPANRGNVKDFGYSPLHHSVIYTTDMPTTKGGRWILGKENEMDRNHIRLIKDIYREIKLKEKLPEQTEYVKRVIKELRSDLDLARRYQPPKIEQKGKTREYTVFFGEYDVFDNLEVLGEDFIWQMYRDSPALIWQTAFLNQRLFKIENGFYSALDEDKHFYIPPDTDKFVGRSVKSAVKTNCLLDTDLDYSAPLHIAFDANAAISTCVVGQVDRATNTMKVLSSFFVKTPLKIQDLVQKVADYYAPKFNKDIIFYFDHTFTWTTASNDESYADVVVRKFTENRYNITPVYIGQQPKHVWRHQQIDMALKGDSGLLTIYMNLYNNEFLKIALEQTGVKLGKDGFEKNKSPESLPDNPENPDEHKTHVTDAFDTLFVGTNFFYTEPSSGCGGVIFM